MPNINTDINFCNEYLQFFKSIEVKELNERYITVEVKMYKRNYIPLTTFYLADPNYDCYLENIFMHYLKNYVKHT